MWTPSHLLVPVSTIQVDIDITYVRACSILQKAVPGAEIHHVGSTAIQHLLCRSIVNLQVLVPGDQIEEATTAIKACAALSDLPLKAEIQVGDKYKPCQALLIRDCFVRDPVLVGEFLGLQKAFVHRTGKSYPTAKEDFFSDLLRDALDSSEAGTERIPYRIELQSDHLRIFSALACDGQAHAAYREKNREHLQTFSPNPNAETFSESYWRGLFAAEALAHWRKQALTLLCYHKTSEQLIATIRCWNFQWHRSRSCSIGYNIDGAYEGQGLMSEGVTAAIHYLFEDWKVHRITAAYDPSNLRSAKLLKGLGFQIEGLAPQYIELDGTWRDAVLVALTRSP